MGRVKRPFGSSGGISKLGIKRSLLRFLKHLCSRHRTVHARQSRATQLLLKGAPKVIKGNLKVELQLSEVLLCCHREDLFPN